MCKVGQWGYGGRVLSQVATIREVCNLWGLSYSGVMYNIMADKIIADQSLDGRWMVWLPSVTQQFGTPPYPGKRVRPLDFSGVNEGGELGEGRGV